jgi:hypothetical protein
VKADAARGGFVVDNAARRTNDPDSHLPAAPAQADFAKLGPDVSATVHGQWGFESFEGPTFPLRTAQPAKWAVASADQSALIVGRDDTLHLHSDAAVCVSDVSVEDQQGKKLTTTHKLVNPSELRVDISLKDAKPGPLTMQVKQFGIEKAEDVALHTYSEAGHVAGFTINAGDHQGVLTGTRLDEVASLEIGGINFAPGTLTRAENEDQLQMSAPASADVSGLQPGKKQTAQVALKDGRTLDLDATVQPPRPKVTLIGKTIQPDTSAASSPIHLQSNDELPQNAQLSFSLKSQVPQAFPRDETVEVASADQSIHTVLSIADGTLLLQDSQTVLAVLDPLKSFGASAFGPLQFRPINADGEKGDWQPLVTLVRLPKLQELRCPDTPDKECTLHGSGLYLLDSVSTDPEFHQSTPVPDGFAGSALNVPHPNGQDLYVKLRDDRSAVNKLDLPILPAQ